MSAKDTGATFLEQLLAQVPEDRQAAVREALASDSVLTELGAAVLRQSDYSRNQDEIQRYKAQLDAWFAENKALLDRALQTPATPATPSASSAPAIQSPATGLTREDLLAELQQREQAAIAAIVTTNQLSTKHYATFQEVLDIAGLMRDPQINDLGLMGVYDKHYKPKYDELAQQAETARIEAEVKKRLDEERRKHPHMPYPVNSHEPSPLDAITRALAEPHDPSKPVPLNTGGDVLDLAVADYTAALSRRHGTPAI